MIKLKNIINELLSEYIDGGWLSPSGKYFSLHEKRMNHDWLGDEIIHKFKLTPKISGDGTSMLGSLGWLRIVISRYPLTMFVDRISFKESLTKEQKRFIEDWIYEDINREVVLDSKRHYKLGDDISTLTEASSGIPMWTYSDAKPIAQQLNAKIVGSVKTKGKSDHDLDLLVTEYNQQLSNILNKMGFTYMGSQVVSPLEINRSRKFGQATSWLRNRRFENLLNNKVIEIWSVETGFKS